MTRAVVFAYHNVGARCLEVLLRHGIEVPLVVTHDDDPREAIWFERVADIASGHGIPFITPADPNTDEIVERIRDLRPAFLFSFYYRHMLSPALLALPARGALNMHGSLLPKYRGRAPVNWAVLHGESETGATLHYMATKPDAGDIVAQTAVPVLPDETAQDVFEKVTAAAVATLDRVVLPLVEGRAPRIPQDLAKGSYFGGRKPEDGRIDWSRSAREIHNLVRAVAPPYPGAFTTVVGDELRVLRTRVDDDDVPAGPACMYIDGGRLFADCGGGGRLEILAAELAGAPFAPATLAICLSEGPNPVAR
ncbi:MAG: formyltransferase [Betaproteobacteria bacterium]